MLCTPRGGTGTRPGVDHEHMLYIPLWNPYMFSWRTNDEMFVCLKYCLYERTYERYILPRNSNKIFSPRATTYARTFEKSEVGDMTKLSFELDQDIRC